MSTVPRGHEYARAAVDASGGVAVEAIDARLHTTPLLNRHPAAFLAASQLLLLLATAPWYSAFGLEIAWTTAGPLMAGHVALAAAWLYFRRYSSHPTKYIVPDVVLVTMLLVLLTDIVAPAQYLAVALKWPLVDEWLAGADAAMGVHVPTLAAWTAAHPWVSQLLTLCYFSLLPQFLLPLLFIGLRFRDREGLWEYAFHFHFCLIVTLAALAIFPAECAFLYYGFESTIDQTRFVSQFSALRAGTFQVLAFGDLEGLISMPSFHVAGAVTVTWAFRRHRSILLPLCGLNGGLIAATFMSGAHYFIDVIASLLLFAVSVAVYRWWVAPATAIAGERRGTAMPAYLQ